MKLPFLIYCSLLKKAQYRNLRDLADVHHGAVDMAQVDQAMRVGVDKRLEMARDFLLFAENLLSSPGTASEMTARNAISRAYYAVHHAMRALLLFEERGDVDGHREAIEAVVALLKRNAGARSQIGEIDAFRGEIRDLLDQRHLADYYPYGSNAPNESPADFSVIATTALDFAKRVVEGVSKYISLKEAGKI